MKMTTLKEDEDAITRNKRYVESLHKWILADRDRFICLRNAAFRIALKSRKISRERLNAELERYGYSLGNHNHYQALARYLRALYPELKDYIKINPSYVDRLTLPTIPRCWAIQPTENTGRELSAKDWQ